MNPFETLPGRDAARAARLVRLPAADPRASVPAQPLLVDVRTDDEARRQPVDFAHVHVPVLTFEDWDTGGNRGRDFNRFTLNPGFVPAVSEAFAERGMARGEPVLLFCPTTRRARWAACRLRQAGFLRPYALSLAAARMVWGHPAGVAPAHALVHSL
jgi:rhodanese-related sulfurtransferase